MAVELIKEFVGFPVFHIKSAVVRKTCWIT